MRKEFEIQSCIEVPIEITEEEFVDRFIMKRGPNNKFNKYLFYGFYPLHLWLLAIIKFALK